FANYRLRFVSKNRVFGAPRRIRPRARYRPASDCRLYRSVSICGPPSNSLSRRKAMRFGLFGINIGVCANGQSAAQVAQAAEAVGFESVWTGEHVVLPDPQAPPSPLPPEAPILDPAVALAVVASHTRRLRLGTGIIILPQRNPLVLAKELASVDVVSG